MPQLKKKKRRESEIPTASMADIAFLLLIFFLVTTVIDVDTGIGMVLPPPLDEDQTPPPVLERNMLKILVNEVGQLLMEDKPANVDQVKAEVMKHVQNNGADPNYSDSPTKALISIKNARETPYRAYIAVLDRTWMAYFEIWDSEARKLGFPDYKAYVESLGDEDNAIRKKYPAAISIAEPDAQ